MTKTFKQYDSRWGSHKYPSGKWTMSNSGCGPTAVADIIVNNPKHANKTPDDVRKFMIQHDYATCGNGTMWSGIKAAMLHYGFAARWPDTMGDLFKLLNKGPWDQGVLLLKKGTKGGVTWTTSGHYLAYDDYKYENNKHWFKMHDPGPRDNDGWFCYETQMKGLVGNCWCGYLPDKEMNNKPEKYKGVFPKLPDRGYFQRGDKGQEVILLQEFLNWATDCSLEVDGKLGGATARAVIVFQTNAKISPDGYFGKQCLKAAKKMKR